MKRSCHRQAAGLGSFALLLAITGCGSPSGVADQSKVPAKTSDEAAPPAKTAESGTPREGGGAGGDNWHARPPAKPAPPAVTSAEPADFAAIEPRCST